MQTQQMTADEQRAPFPACAFTCACFFGSLAFFFAFSHQAVPHQSATPVFLTGRSHVMLGCHNCHKDLTSHEGVTATGVFIC